MCFSSPFFLNKRTQEIRETIYTHLAHTTKDNKIYFLESNKLLFSIQGGRGEGSLVCGEDTRFPLLPRLIFYGTAETASLLYIYIEETTFLLNLFRIRGFAIYPTAIRFFPFLRIERSYERNRFI